MRKLYAWPPPPPSPDWHVREDGLVMPAVRGGAIVNGPEIYVPPMFGGGVSAPSASTQATINATGDKWGYVLKAGKTGNIHKIYARFGTVTTPQTVDARVETISSRVPSGTLFGTNTNGNMTPVSDTVVAATLTADAAVTKGQAFALSFVVPSGTPNFIALAGYGEAPSGFMPYWCDGSSGTYSAKLNGGMLNFACEYDDGSFGYIPYALPVAAANIQTFNSGSTPDEIALYFQLPFSARVAGGWLAVDLDNSMDVVLYDSDGTTALQTVALANTERSSTSGLAPYYFLFDTPQTLAADTYYWLSCKPGASNVTVYSYSVGSSTIWDQTMPYGGQLFNYSSRTDAGSWSQNANRRVLAGVLLDGVDVSSGSSGGHVIGGGF